MKLLNRPILNVKLARYHAAKQGWEKLKPEDRSVILSTLLEMSNNRCSYCETNISNNNRHIEHFAPRNTNPRLTFEWSNLFCSCNNEMSCGKHKDNKQKYNGNGTNLIKPDIDNPVDFFIVNENDGLFSAKPNLSPSDKEKAENTIFFFNLNLTSLVNKRKFIFKLIRDSLPDCNNIHISKEKEEELKFSRDSLKEFLVSENAVDLGYLQPYLELVLGVGD